MFIMLFLMSLLRVVVILQVQLNQDELQRIITEAKEELGCVKITYFLAFYTMLKCHISQH